MKKIVIASMVTGKGKGLLSLESNTFQEFFTCTSETPSIHGHSRILALLFMTPSVSIILHGAWVTILQNCLALNWIPCLGDPDTYEPLTSFEEYNPRMQRISYAVGLDMFDHNEDEQQEDTD